jgi:hypothetical protein
MRHSCSRDGLYPKATGICGKCGRTDAPLANGSDRLLPHLAWIGEGEPFHATVCCGRPQRPKTDPGCAKATTAGPAGPQLAAQLVVNAPDLNLDLQREAHS